MSEVDNLTEQLGKTSLPEEGVSFAGKGLVLNNAEDAKEVIEQINACPNMEYLNLEGNTVGVEAAKAIAEALQDKSRFRKAFWKDMFTGRMKNEIPIALKHLSEGLMSAGARLEVLELSDNAAGPIGAEGIVHLLKSPTCYTLKELKLNNMGLGITGAKMLAEALKTCYERSKEAGTPLALRVFIAGRNRLENEGSKALAAVFEKMGSLEVIEVPQNGIYLPGVRALSKAIACNPQLKVINLNDNTLNPEGSGALAEALTSLEGLVRLDLGDCLIKNQGALRLAEALATRHSKLEELIVSFNSIRTEGGLALVEAMTGKADLKTLRLEGNNFGDEGAKLLRDRASQRGSQAALGSLSEDEGSGSEEEDDDDDGDGEEDEEEQSSCEEEDGSSEKNSSCGEEEERPSSLLSSQHTTCQSVGAKAFLENPTESNLKKLGDRAPLLILQEIKSTEDGKGLLKALCEREKYTVRKDLRLIFPGYLVLTSKERNYDSQLDELMKVIIQISGLLDPESHLEDERSLWTMKVAEELYRALFAWAVERNSLPYINNTLPVYLGLIKDEETKKPLKDSKLGSCRLAVTRLMRDTSFPDPTREILTALMKFHQR